MALSLGARVGTYEIVSVLGAGGMGEVYRARDLRLGRSVAIKGLRQALAGHPDRHARFEREARALAALNHPNIAQLFGVEDGPDGLVLVMELVDGPTLAGRIAGSPMRIDEALRLAAQIAAALETAHEHGVVHRDLKPANIKVRPDGVVKVLDFGLAKMLADDLPQSPDGAYSTLTSPAMTSEGVILGTAAYMSPEQARGLAVDRRTDVWAFGCVLFEMLTGRQPFAGRTATDVMAAVIEREPEWQLLPASTPAAIRRLLRRCLSKDPKQRLHDMADARLEIDDAIAAPVDVSSSESRVVPRSRAIAWAIGIAGAAAAASAITWALATRAAPAGSDGLSSDAEVTRLTYDAGVSRMPALSRDGRLLAYASDRAGNGGLDIWLQQMAGGTPLRLTDDPAGDTHPSFSPDGSQLAFRSERSGGGVYVVSTLGGPARLIAAEGRGPRFSPDGKRLAYWTGQFRGQNVSSRLSSSFVVDLAGGTPTRLVPDFAFASNPVWTTDGRAVILAGGPAAPAGEIEGVDWWRVPVDGGAPVKTGVRETAPFKDVPAFAPAQVLPDGVLFSFRDDLWRLRLDATGRLESQPQRLTLGVGPYVEPAAGPDGEIVFAREVSVRAIERASLTTITEPAVRLYSDSGTTTWRATGTPDGSAMVFEREVDGGREIWIKNIVSGRQEMVVRVPARSPVNATISDDGSRIAYTKDADESGLGAGTGYVVQASGGVPRQVCTRCAMHGFLADGRRVLAVEADGRALRLVDTVSGAARDLVVSRDGSRLDRPHASPDGRLLAFRRTVGATGKTHVIAMPADQPAVASGDSPIDEPTTTGRPAGWSMNSGTLYLLLDADGFRCLWAQPVDAAARAVGAPAPARHFHAVSGMSTSFGNAVTAQGFLYEAEDATANLWKLQRVMPR